MKIRLRTTYASPKITAVSGSVIDVSKKEADELVSGGYATYEKEAKAKTAIKTQPENTATQTGKPAGDAPETNTNGSENEENQQGEAAKGNTLIDKAKNALGLNKDKDE